MNIKLIFAIISIIWVLGVLLYFYFRKKPKIIAQTKIKEHEKKIYGANIFAPVQNEIKNLTVNLIYDDKEQVDTSQFCDFVITVKELLEYNSQIIKDGKNNIFKPIDLEIPKKEELIQEEQNVNIEKKADTNFNQLFNINLITNK